MPPFSKLVGSGMAELAFSWEFSVGRYAPRVCASVRSCNWGLRRSTDSSMLFSSAILTACSTVSWMTGRASARSSSVLLLRRRGLRLALHVNFSLAYFTSSSTRA